MRWGVRFPTGPFYGANQECNGVYTLLKIRRRLQGLGRSSVSFCLSIFQVLRLCYYYSPFSSGMTDQMRVVTGFGSWARREASIKYDVSYRTSKVHGGGVGQMNDVQYVQYQDHSAKTSCNICFLNVINVVLLQSFLTLIDVGFTLSLFFSPSFLNTLDTNSHSAICSKVVTCALCIMST